MTGGLITGIVWCVVFRGLVTILGSTGCAGVSKPGAVVVGGITFGVVGTSAAGGL